MARTVEAIEAEIIAEKDANAALSVYDNVSATARWRQWVYIIALAFHVLETIFDAIRAEIFAKAEANKAGTPLWYAEQAKAFQFGYTVELINDLPGYATADDAAKIVKRASVNNTANAGEIEMKVAKLDSGGAPTPLTTPELDALRAYFAQVGYAGTLINYVDENADIVDVGANVYYNAQTPAAEMQTALSDAVDAYLAAIDFDGKFYRERLRDALQAVPNVVDVDITSIAITDFAAVVTANPREHRFSAGYAVSGGLSFNLIQTT